MGEGGNGRWEKEERKGSLLEGAGEEWIMLGGRGGMFEEEVDRWGKYVSGSMGGGRWEFTNARREEKSRYIGEYGRERIQSCIDITVA